MAPLDTAPKESERTLKAKRVSFDEAAPDHLPELNIVAPHKSSVVDSHFHDFCTKKRIPALVPHESKPRQTKLVCLFGWTIAALSRTSFLPSQSRPKIGQRRS